MNRRSLISIGSGIAAASLFIAACSSTGATSAPSGGGAGASIALPSLPSVSIPSLPSVALPSNLPSIALPSSLPSSLPSVELPSNLPSIALPSSLPSIAIPSNVLPSGSFAIPSFSFPSEDKDLESKLPNQVNGVTLTKYSLKGDKFLSQGSGNSQDLIDLLTSLGK